jgi:hypothetical protein
MTNTPNAERAYATLDFILAHPERHNQEIWLEPTECGTAGCFAGLTTILAGDTPELAFFSAPSVISADTRRRRQIALRAQDLLCLTMSQADALFSSSNSLDDLIALTDKFFGPRPEAK